MKPVTAADAAFRFYDIESLHNAFTLCTYDTANHNVYAFYLTEPGDVLDQQVRALDPSELYARIHEAICRANPAYLALAGEAGPRIGLFDLSRPENVAILAHCMALDDIPGYPRGHQWFPGASPVVRDIDDAFDPMGEREAPTPYIAGYNSYNYDTTMLAAFFMQALAFNDDLRANRSEGYTPPPEFSMVRPSDLRAVNDELFSSEHRKYMPSFLMKDPSTGGRDFNAPGNLIRQSLLHTGRHIDVARLNETQQRVALKRLLGMLGRQVLESDRLGSHSATLTSIEDLADLLAYNVSDVVNLHHLMRHQVYSGAFDLKTGLLDRYAETVYDTRRGKPSPANVRRDRLAPDATSAKFVGRILAPYDSLGDAPEVSFMYPAPEKAEDLGIEPFDVLEHCKEFFYANIEDPAARRRFDAVYAYYSDIRGKNFNENNPGRAFSLSDIPKLPTNIPYYLADGTPTSCFAAFSTGGIHGAEADRAAFEADRGALLAEARRTRETIDKVIASGFDDPVAAREACGKQEVLNDLGLPVLTNSGKPLLTKDLPLKDEDGEVLLNDKGKPVKRSTQYLRLHDGSFVHRDEFLARGTSIASSRWKDVPDSDALELFEDKPESFGRLNPKYVFTSCDTVIHEDFSSYYPSLLTNMHAFYNPDLGEDRYSSIYDEKERLGHEMKDQSLPSEQRELLKVLRNGTKLILNSASGAGDASHDTPIRMNNRIISMRLIGQMFAWLIGQAQTLAGARIVSTNTDGLYSVLDEETNQRVLDEQSARIGVLIEPEPLLLVSKDSNNRLELAMPTEDQDPETVKILGGSGGSLGCWTGPDPRKSLAHPAVVDHVLARCLRRIAVTKVQGRTEAYDGQTLSMTSPLPRALVLETLREVTQSDPTQALMMFQTMVTASPSSITYPIAIDDLHDGADPLDAYASASAEPEERHESVAAMRELHPRNLQHINRVFVVRTGTEGSVKLIAAAGRKIPSNQKGQRERWIDEIARELLAEQGIAAFSFEAGPGSGMEVIENGRDMILKRITGIDASWSMIVDNRDLHHLDEAEKKRLLDQMDLEVYADMICETFEDNWMNRPRQDRPQGGPVGSSGVPDEPRPECAPHREDDASLEPAEQQTAAA